MKILAIETSCDETAAAVVENGTKILSSVVASSQELHVKTGGIIPEQAAREQVRAIIPVINESLSPLRQGYKEINAIAVTIGPGLVGSLLVGVETAKCLSYLWNKPIVPVNHLLGHIYANWIEQTGKNAEYKKPEFPAIALIVSGGHTDLVYMREHGKIKWLGGTRDDAAGEAFDKCARILGLGYPGGPAISAAAEKFKIKNKKLKINLRMLPRPMINENNFDFSFSGLKTAVLRKSQDKSLKEKLGKNFIPRLAAEIQEATVDSLVKKNIKAVEYYKPKSFLLGGGVAANKDLRKSFAYNLRKLKFQPQLHVPDFDLCTDNAAPIAAAAFYNYSPSSWRKINVNPELTISQKMI